MTHPPSDPAAEAEIALRSQLRVIIDGHLGWLGELRTVEKYGRRLDEAVGAVTSHILADIAALRTRAEEAEARADRINDKLGEMNAAVKECLPPAETLIAEREVAEAARDTLAADLAKSRAEVARLTAALGCHLHADAYRESFPDNDQDAAHNRKSETWWRLMAQCAVPQDDPLHEVCSVAALSMPEVVAHRDAVIAKVTAEHGA